MRGKGGCHEGQMRGKDEWGYGSSERREGGRLRRRVLSERAAATSLKLTTEMNAV